ncbi:expressed unknown protein [Seminavis robusta]|uniref:Uncharacterized protein n=1 Tax=Seminavis robusta TaxID=568900 RepID=A0A9N8D7Y6_9STRA|nr:expressed unknown protein [Seminavis robusta]|eukprot:Sro30_g019500.1 n/a (88) ;mRNA; f:46910-47173
MMKSKDKDSEARVQESDRRNANAHHGKTKVARNKQQKNVASRRKGNSLSTKSTMFSPIANRRLFLSPPVAAENMTILFSDDDDEQME